MCEHFYDRRSVIDIFCQHQSDQVLALLTRRLPNSMALKAERLLSDGIRNRLLSRRFERQLTTDEGKQDDAKTPHINFLGAPG